MVRVATNRRWRISEDSAAKVSWTPEKSGPGVGDRHGDREDEGTEGFADPVGDDLRVVHGGQDGS
jgi:hypothetical protein